MCLLIENLKKYYTRGEDCLNLPMGLQFSMFYSLENGSWVLLAEGRLASYETTTAAATIDFQTKVVSSKQILLGRGAKRKFFLSLASDTFAIYTLVHYPVALCNPSQHPIPDIYLH